MKKVYLLGAILISGVTAFGQLNSNAYNFSSRKINAPKSQASKPEAKKVKATEKAAGDLLWSEDFETGSLTTNNGTWSSVGQDDYWSVGTTHPFWSSGSTDLTGSFLIWNSYDPNANEASFASTSVSGSITSPTIDLTGISSAIMVFNTEAMYCCNVNEFPFRVSISNDNGTTWSDTVSLDFGVGRNSATEYIGSPLSYILKLDQFNTAFTATTKIKFIWESINADQNGQYNTHYYWNIDDIQIIENYNYDVSTEKMWLADMVNDYEYTDIPQAFGGNLTVQAKLRNIGANIPTTLGVKVEIYDTSGVLITSATKGGTLSNNFTYEYDTITFNTGLDLSSLNIDMYNIYAIVEMDQTDENAANDSIYRTIRISDFYYGQRDYNQGSFYSNYADSDEPSYEPMELGNAMYIPDNIDIHGIEIPISNTTYYPTTAGEELTVNFYEFDPNGDDFQTAHTQLDPVRYFTIESSMVPSSGAQRVLLNFHQATGDQGSVALTGGKYYIVSVAHAGGTDKSFSTLVNQEDEDYSTHLFGDYGSTPGDRWFVAGEQFQARLVFDESLSLNENNTFANVSEVYPNPTTGEATIAYNLGNASNVTVKVVDITGKVVYTVPAENKAAGKHNLNINAASFKSGVYYVTIVTEESQVTKKLIRK